MRPTDNFGEFEFHVAIRTDFHLKLEWCSSTEGVVYTLVEDVVFGQCDAYVYVILRVGFGLGEWCFFGSYKAPSSTWHGRQLKSVWSFGHSVELLVTACCSMFTFFLNCYN